MSDQGVIDLLVEWDEQRRAGRNVSPEELSPNDTLLQAELRERIARRQRLLGVFEAPTLIEEAPAVTVGPLPQISGYELLDIIGHGGMGIVYRARQLGLNRTVALKMVLAGVNASPEHLARFRTEAEAVAHLAHPNIVQIFEIGEQNGCPFLAMEYVSGGSLAAQLDGTPIPAKQAAELVLPLARAVQHAHDRGIVHRDLKPANVLLTLDSMPKIADFGLAKRTDSDFTHTQTGAILGSPSYMAPEQAEGATHKVGPATDIYALGVILYELLTGRPPFKGATLLETIEQVREHQPATPRSLQPRTPRDLETICLKCLEKQPEQRYASAAELANDLKAFMQGEAISAQSPTLLDHMARTISRHSFDARFRRFANRIAIFAPIPLAVHLVAYFLFDGKPYYALAMVATTTLMLLGMLSLLMWSAVTLLRGIPMWQRQHFVTVWAGHLGAMAVILLVAYLAMPRDRPDFLLMVYPLLGATAAMSFLAHATEAGIFYIVGAVLFAVSILMAFTPHWAPLEVAVFMTTNITVQAIYLRRMTQERLLPASPLMLDSKRFQ